MTRTLKILLALLLVAGGGWMLRPWAAQQLGSRARTSYFEQGRAYAPRVLEELGPLPSELRESSGLAVSRTQPGVLWSHNDSGDAPTLYAIDLKGRLLAKVAVDRRGGAGLGGHRGRPLPVGGAAGSNASTSPTPATTVDRGMSLTVFVVVEPTIAGADPARPLPVQARSFRFRYPGQPEDTEAIAVLAEWRRDDRHQGPHADDFVLRHLAGPMW